MTRMPTAKRPTRYWERRRRRGIRILELSEAWRFSKPLNLQD